MDIIATVGPSLLTNGKIDALVSAGVTILRINGAHAAPQETASLIERLRRSAGGRARIMVDLPTNKVRVTNLSAPILFEPGDTFVLDSAQLNYPALCKLVRAGDEVIINNGIDRLRVTRVNPDSIEFQTKFACRLDNNRGLIFVRDIHTPGFPFFFQRDLELIEVINDLNVDLVGLSYLRHQSDKEAALQRIANPHSLIYKIETRVAFNNFDTLIQPGDKILIDRGDLAGEIGLLHIPRAQDRLIRCAHRQRVDVYLATQFLATMEHAPIPQIAEVCALYDVIDLGISGIQLSEETAVGKFPLEAVRWIKDVEKLVNQQGRLRASPANFVPAARKPPKPRTLGSSPVGASLPEPAEKRGLLRDRGARRSASRT